MWRLIADMAPEQIVDLVDWRYLSDALTPAEALDLLVAARPGRAERIARLEQHGYPAYTTSPGWLGYSDEKLVRLSRAAVADGYPQIKLKVGADRAVDFVQIDACRVAGVNENLAILLLAAKFGTAVHWYSYPGGPAWA